MGKIKGWKKYRVDKNKGSITGIEYRNDETFMSVALAYHRLGGWTVQVSASDNYPVFKKFDLTKSQALKIATQYMRSHPRG